MARNSQGPWFRKASGSWYATIHGRRVALGVTGRGNRPKAVEAWKRLLAGPQSTVGVGGVSVRRLIDGFLADATARTKPHTSKVYGQLLRPLADRFGRRPASGFTPRDAERFAASRPTWGPTTRRQFLSALVTAFRWAVRARLLPTNPLEGVRKPPQISRGTKAVISTTDHAKLIAAAHPRVVELLTLLWLTGARPSELYRLTAADVDLAAGAAVLHDHKTADTGRPRVILFPPAAMELLAELVLRHPTGPLLRKPLGNPWGVDGLYQQMRVLGRRAGVTGATAYGYRHTFATDALARGVPDAHVAALLGHAKTTTLHKHYSHLTGRAAELRAAAERVRG